MRRREDGGEGRRDDEFLFLSQAEVASLSEQLSSVQTGKLGLEHEVKVLREDLARGRAEMEEEKRTALEK